MEAQISSKRPQVLLGAGASLGLALAMAGVLAPGGRRSALSDDAVAVVNGEAVSRAEYERAIAALTADRRGAVGDAERRRVIERLVDEELLIQRALDLGLVRRDRRLRGELVSVMIQSIVSEVTEVEPTDEEVASFYDRNRDYFTQPGRIRLRQIVIEASANGEGGLDRARAARARLMAGEPFARVREELGGVEIAPLPDAPLPPAKLREYLGPTAVRTALALEPGEVSDPVRSTAGYHVLQLVEREVPRVPPLEEVDAEVRAEYRRRAGEGALRGYLDGLKRSADVNVAPDVS
jgi:parvulin-like peptidyl-prolyl isomerase